MEEMSDVGGNVLLSIQTISMSGFQFGNTTQIMTNRTKRSCLEHFIHQFVVALVARHRQRSC